MIINHNMNAIIAQNRANKQSGLKNDAMQKLSSGLRINSAGDDSAGASISEKMKAQIRGLERAHQNIQDGISLIQTAEAGLGSIQNPNLIRMKELCEQALNGTLTSEDRMNIQHELDGLKAGINDIAEDTEFNTTKVLRPPVTEIPPTSNSMVDIVFVVDNTGSMSSIQSTVADNITNFVNSIAAKGVSDIRMGVVEYRDSTINEFQFSGSKWTGSTTDIHDALISLSTSNNGGTEDAMAALTKTINDYDFRENIGSAQTKNIIFITNEDADDADNTTSPNLISTLADLKNKNIRVHGIYETKASDVSEFNQIISETNGKSVNFNDSDWGNQLSNIIGDNIGTSGAVIESDEMPTLKLQVGANSNEEFQIKLFDARTEKLGIDAVNVDTIEYGRKSLDLIDDAMKKVTEQRSKFGAYQNALEHIGNNVDNYGYNLTASQSRIADIDMAKETMELTKSSILEESAESMLKQSEKMSETIINLMDKWKQQG